MPPTTRISRPALIIVFIFVRTRTYATTRQPIMISRQFSFLSLSLLTQHVYNPISSISSHMDVVPPTYHDVVDASTSTLGAPLRHRANATFVMLARNSDIDGAVNSVREMEDRFNRNRNYPWVFLNEQPFSTEFKRCARYHSLNYLCILILMSSSHKSRVGSRLRVCAFWPDPRRALASTCVDQRDKGEGRKR